MIILRILLFLVLLGLVANLVMGAPSEQGEVVINWLGYEVATSGAVLAGLLAVALILAFIGGQIWSFLVNLPYRLATRRHFKKEKAGLDTLFAGLEAISSGDAETARKLAKRSRQLLPDERLSAMLEAEAAQSQGREKEAASHFERLGNQSGSEFLGLRGLLAQAVRLGQWGSALPHAQKALTMQPKSPWVVGQAYNVYLHCGRYEDALEVLPKLAKLNHLTSEQVDFEKACINLQLAAMHSADQDNAMAFAKKSLRAYSNFVPALEFKLETYKAAGKTGDMKSLQKKIDSLTMEQTNDQRRRYKTWCEVYVNDKAGGEKLLTTQ